MTRSRYGLLAGIAGAALATWWFSRRRMAGSPADGADRVEVIYSNTPAASY